jgi:hypothetical protein
VLVDAHYDHLGWAAPAAATRSSTAPTTMLAASWR